ncbi:MAG: hypothetical protein PPP56_03980 [Longimonas sp.]|uniref:Y-family DNA polymerase n=1 Tax=Longimonas sp. TaxID=2039626 RepID=UPI00335E69D0
MIGCLYVPEYPAWSLNYLHAQHGRTSDAGVAATESEQVVAATPAAQRAGVVSGMSLSHAQERAPDVRFLARDPRAESAVWVDVMQGLNAYTPRIASVRPGTLYFDPVDTEQLCHHLETLHVQAALAPDRPAARLGALCAEPSTLMRLGHDDTASLLYRFRTERLLELGYPLDMLEVLTEQGYDSLAPLQTISRRWLVDAFGSHGRRLHALLHPSRVDRSPVPFYTAPSTVMRAMHWDQPAAYWEMIQPVLARLLSQAVSKLGAQTCQRITVQMVDAQSGAVLRDSRLLQHPTRTRSALSPVAHQLLRALMQPGLEVKTLRVILGVLSIPEVYPDVFFRTAPPLAVSSELRGRNETTEVAHPAVETPASALRKRV